MKRRTILKQWNRYLKSCARLDIETAKTLGGIRQWYYNTGRWGTKMRFYQKQSDAINLVTNSGVLWPYDKVTNAVCVQVLRYKKASAGRLRCMSRCARAVAPVVDALPGDETASVGD